jgi:hypothetical protein
MPTDGHRIQIILNGADSRHFDMLYIEPKSGLTEGHWYVSSGRLWCSQEGAEIDRPFFLLP